MTVEFSSNIRDMTPIETKYKKYWFRSRLEARWAVFFDELDLIWSYEIQGFRLDNNTKLYLPDFYIGEVKTPWEMSTDIWVEIKGVMKKKNKETCKALAMESLQPVLLIQGDPVESDITLFRKHTPVQKVHLSVTGNGNLRIMKKRRSNRIKKVVNAEEKARSKRF